MKKLTSLIQENTDNKTYKYTATVKVEGTVTAATEGDAGANADKKLEKITGFVSATIDNVEEVKSEIKESVFNDNSNDAYTVDYAFKEFAEFYTNCDAYMSREQMSDLKDRIANYIAEHQ